MFEARDEVGTTYNVLGIEEPKCALVVVGGKLDTVQALCFPPRPMFLVDLEPADPQDVHICQFGHGGMENLDPIDPKDARVHVWMGRVATRERHHVWAASHVDLVHPSPEVVRGVIHAHRTLSLKAVPSDEDLVTVVICEGRGFRIVLAVKDAGEEVVHQFRDKILGSGSVRYAAETRGSTCFHSRVVRVLAEYPFVESYVAAAPF